MKKTFILIFVILPFFLSAQELKCCKTKQDVEKYISGYWKEKDSDAKVLYQYWFENGKGNLTTLEKLEGEEEYTIIDNHPFIEIKESEGGFKLIYTHLYGVLHLELKYLSQTKMILVDNDEDFEYVKVEM